MSKVKITKRNRASDSEEAKNFHKKWEIILSERKEGTIDSQVTVKSKQDLAEFLVQGWIEFGFNLAVGLGFDDEMKAILLKEWGKDLIKNLNNVDWDEVGKKDEDEDEDDDDEEEEEEEDED